MKAVEVYPHKAVYPIMLQCIRIKLSYIMNPKPSCYCDNIHVNIYFKCCNLYFLSVDSDLGVDLRMNALLLQEFFEQHYVHIHIKAFLAFLEPYGKHPFQYSIHDPSDLFHQTLSVHKRKKKIESAMSNALQATNKFPGTGYCFQNTTTGYFHYQYDYSICFLYHVQEVNL